MTDPIADMIIRIKNAVATDKNSVSLPHSKLKEAILAVLEKELVEALAVIEKELLKKNCIVSSRFYGVDVMLTQTLLWAKARGHCEGFTNINSYIERNVNRPAFPKEFYENQ